MNLIDHYVEAVAVRGPEKLRAKVREELRVKISSMLPENATEDEIFLVLEELGDPKRLADNYFDVKRYLIGPSYYDSYLTTLKLVTIIAAVISIIAALLKGILYQDLETNSLELSINLTVTIFSSLIQGIAQSFLWVTVIFVILEKRGISVENKQYSPKKWSANSFQEAAVSYKTKISRIETVFAIFFTSLFISVIVFMPEIFGWYSINGNTLTLDAPLFVVDRLKSYLVFIILLTFFQICLLIYKFFTGHWTVSVAIANTVFNIGQCILIIIMTADQNLFNQQFIDHLAQFTSAPLIKSMWSGILKAFAILFVAGCSIDSIVGFVKSRKHTKHKGVRHIA